MIYKSNDIPYQGMLTYVSHQVQKLQEVYLHEKNCKYYHCH